MKSPIIGYSKDVSNRKREEQNDGGDCGQLSLRLTSHPASGSHFVLHTSGSGLPWTRLGVRQTVSSRNRLSSLKKFSLL